jgi:sarcosine oxidase
MGSAACYHLAKRGARVLGLEQHGIPHALGAHHGHSRMIRLAYYEHPDYVPLLGRAYTLWNELEEESGQKLLHITGGLYAGPSGAEIVAGSVKAAREHGLDHECWDGADLRNRFPQFCLPEDYEAFFEPRAGFLVPEAAVSAHATCALQRGAVLHGHEKVTEWKAMKWGVKVETNKGAYSAGHVVFASGAWSGSLLGGSGIDLEVTRQTLAWFWPREPEMFQLGRFPCWFIETEPGYGHYGFPIMPGVPGLKIALHKPGQVTTADTVNRSVTAKDEAQVRWVLRDHLPKGEGPLLSIQTCLYTNSADSHFIVGPVPNQEHNNVSVACGFSGHGFKASSVVGEVLAELVLDGRSSLPTEFLSPQRFQ